MRFKKVLPRSFLQFCKFSVVGGVATLIDYAIMFGLTNFAGVDYAISGAISFCISLVVNYLLSMRFVFVSSGDRTRLFEFVSFSAIGLVGLGINQAALWFFTEKAGLYYMLSKVIATALVLFWNFFMRKFFIEKKRPKKNRLAAVPDGKEG